MSRAFTREDDSESALADIGERPVSQHRNIVTPEGLAAIDAELHRLRAELGMAEGAASRERIATVSRDLRYWNSRRETAEVSVPEPDSPVLRFGMTVTIEDDADNRNTWRIVGEDEADAAHGTISHVSPMALALFGKSVGDLATVNGKEWEIVAMEAGQD
ncbi:transcription elongation factor [Mesorhizobium sp. NBSH29]|uniref:GreA/GreB family elongation factor n=1 Tax=Mesorhizobium sp. NBSH29 TaxID=2654249 RepID=UPI0018969944|nr:GreA/GreB family elongation factor [Mesorhizobium sp. NBSH29]QPC87164.1 transcription elongation factor [Mesorhizobium sp. NBSH29]